MPPKKKVAKTEEMPTETETITEKVENTEVPNEEVENIQKPKKPKRKMTEKQQENFAKLQLANKERYEAKRKLKEQETNNKIQEVEVKQEEKKEIKNYNKSFGLKNDKPPPKQEVAEEVEEEEEEEEVVIPVVEPVKKVKKKRKPMTPEHLAKLAVAREKAFAVKAKKKAERDEIRDLQTKVVNKKNKKIKDIIMENLDDDELPVHMRREVKEKVVPPARETMSKQQIAEAVALGVETYDAKRRAEKKTKKEAMAQQEKQNDNIRKISNAMNLGTNAWDAYLR